MPSPWSSTVNMSNCLSLSYNSQWISLQRNTVSSCFFFSQFLTIVLFQITLLIAGIGWGDTTSRKIIYWGMLTGDILLIAIQSAFVHSMSEWHAFNIAIVTLASAFGLFRIITLIFNPSWWLWVPEPNFWVTAIC